MGTEYKRFPAPITSIRLEFFCEHVHVEIWVNHAKAGRVVFRLEEWNQLWPPFFYSGQCVLKTSYGGDDKGMVITEFIDNLDSDEYLISEHGEIVQVKDIREKQGEDDWEREKSCRYEKKRAMFEKIARECGLEEFLPKEKERRRRHDET